MRRLSFSIFTCTLLLSACSSPHLAPPPPAPAESYTASYTGSAVDNVGRADVEMVLIQAGDVLTGNVLLNFAVGLARYSAAGDVTGRVDGDTLRLRLTPADPDYCPYQATVTRSSAKLEGNYVGVGCIEQIKGTLKLERQ